MHRHDPREWCWLLMPFILPLVAGMPRKVMETLLTIFFACVSGIRRPFHYCDEHDIGLGLLSGRWSIMHGSILSRCLQDIVWHTTKKMMDVTRPQNSDRERLLSIDEHVVARFSNLVNLGTS